MTGVQTCALPIFGDDENSAPIVGHWEPYQIGTDKWIYISAGHLYSFAIRSDGTLWVCGINTNGQLGLGDINERHIFTRVGTDTDWIKVSSGYNHTIATKSDGTVWACGSNINGEIGLGDLINITTFRQVSANNVSDINSGEYHSIILESTDNTSLWTTDNFLGYFLVNQEIEPIDISIPGNNNTYTILNNNTNLSLSGGILSGIPTITGKTSITIRVIDHNHNNSDRTFIIHGVDPPVWNIPPQLTGMNISLLDTNDQFLGHSDHSIGWVIPTATKGIQYSHKLIMNQYKAAPTRCDFTGGSLPPGLSLQGDEWATLSGIPTGTPGWYNFRLTYYISSTHAGDQIVSLFVGTIPVWQTKQLLPCAYNNSQLGATKIVYNTTLVAIDETLNSMVYHLKSGSKLPIGLTLNSSSGVLFGTPKISGTVKFTITASNDHGSVDREFTYFTKTLPIWKTNNWLNPGHVDIQYSTFIYAIDSDTGDKITYYLKNGSNLPIGLSITPSNNGIILSGTPTIDTQEGTFTLIATDLYGGSVERNFIFTLNKNVSKYFDLTNIKISVLDVFDSAIVYVIYGLPSNTTLTIHPLSPIQHDDVKITNNIYDSFLNVRDFVNELYPNDVPTIQSTFLIQKNLYSNDINLTDINKIITELGKRIEAEAAAGLKLAPGGMSKAEGAAIRAEIQRTNTTTQLANAYMNKTVAPSIIKDGYSISVKEAQAIYRDTQVSYGNQLEVVNREQGKLDYINTRVQQLWDLNRPADQVLREWQDKGVAQQKVVNEANNKLTSLGRDIIDAKDQLDIASKPGNANAVAALSGASMVTVSRDSDASPVSWIDDNTWNSWKQLGRDLNSLPELPNLLLTAASLVSTLSPTNIITEMLVPVDLKTGFDNSQKSTSDLISGINDVLNSKNLIIAELQKRSAWGDAEAKDFLKQQNGVSDGISPYTPQPTDPIIPPPVDDIRNQKNPDYIPPPNPGDFGQPDWTDSIDNPLTVPGWQREDFIDGIDDYPDKSLENETPNPPPPDVGQFNVGGAGNYMDDAYNSGFYSNNGGNGNSGGSGSGGNGNGGNGDNGSGDNGNGGGQYFPPPGGPSTPGDIPGGPDQNPGCNAGIPPDLNSIGAILELLDALWECCDPCNGPPPDDGPEIGV